MLTSSKKSKGRRAAQETKELLMKYLPDVPEQDIMITPSGVNGPDVTYPLAIYELLRIIIETKNVEKINIWQAYEQAKSHIGKDAKQWLAPTVFFKRNRSELMVCLSADDFMKLIL